MYFYMVETKSIKFILGNIFQEMFNKLPPNPKRSYTNWAGQKGTPMIPLRGNDFFNNYLRNHYSSGTYTI